MIRRQILQPLRSRLLSTTCQKHQPTIYALSTKYGRAAIGVVRVSGPQTGLIYSRLTNKNWHDQKPRVAIVRRLYLPTTGLVLDEALTLPFHQPRSYTGEDSLELHLHGGTAICTAVLNAIGSLHNPPLCVIRYAENGEFSKRAFVNGRFDLTEIEGIKAVIDAETESQRILAMSSVTGGTSTMFSSWRNEILHNMALLTTVIDFGEDHDVEEINTLFKTVNTNITQLSVEISNYLLKCDRLEVLLRGIKLVLLGPPNAGKSSLMNLLVNHQAAIVSDVPGTTRDTINVPVDIGGYKVIVGDTAGIRSLKYDNYDDNIKIEAEGIRRTKTLSRGADIIMAVLPMLDCQSMTQVTDHISLLNELGKQVMIVLNKLDLVPDSQVDDAVLRYSTLLRIPREQFRIISCLTGKGVTELQEGLVQQFKRVSDSVSHDPIVVSTRTKDLIRHDVLYGFEQFHQCYDIDDIVLACESLKQSVEGIGKITGDAIGVEEILQVVFSSFCIGK